MIAVVGALVHAAGRTGGGEVAGMAGAIARAAVADGAEVQAIARIGEDPAGDALVVALGRAGIGHAALLRDPARPTPLTLGGRDAADPTADTDIDPAADPDDAAARDAAPPDEILPADPALRPTLEAADLELALRYLPGIRTIVAADQLEPDVARVVAAAASWAGARFVGIVDERVPAATREAYGEEATLLAAPASDPDEVFARLVGAFAAKLDGGAEPVDAFRAAVKRVGWEPADPA